jgi:YD repeat-containing protein
VARRKGSTVQRLHLVVLAFFFSLFPLLGTFAVPASAGQRPAGAASRASLPAATLRPVKMPALWTATSRTYRIGDRYVAHLHTSPVNYWAHGAWHPIDTTLIPSHQPGAAFQTRANSYTALFPADLGEGMIRLQTAAGWVAFGLTGLHAHPRVSGNQVTYAVPGARITYTAGVSSLKEDITLFGPSSPARFHYRLATSRQLTIQRDTSGITIRSRSGKSLFSFAPPSMRDAAGASSPAVRLTVHHTTLTLTASRHWLARSHRRYPVVIDPTTVVLSPSQGCTLNQAAPTTASCNTTGTLSNVSGAQKNILLQFNLSSIPSNSEVLDANLGLDVTAATGTAPFTLNAYQVTHSWTTAATWNTYDGVNAWTNPGGDNTGIVMGQNTNVYSSGAGFYYFQPVQLVQDWVNGIAANDGIEFKVASPASSTLTIAASPNSSLTITYAPWLGIRDFWTFDGGVNVANGNLALGQFDLGMTGIGLPLEVNRYYNSLNASVVGAFGSGWSSSVGPDVKLSINSDGVIDFTGPSGFQVPFYLGIDPNCRGLCGPTYISPPGIDADLTTSGSGYTLTDHVSQQKLNFNASGQFTSDVDRSGNTLTYTYDGSGRLSTITDTQGRTTSFAYTSSVASTLITQITDPAGRTYGYSYDSNKNLIGATDPAGHTVSYSYDAGHNLTQITYPNHATDPSGHETQITFDASHRVTAIKEVTNTTTGAGNSTTYTYNTGNTVVTDPNGHSVTYTYDGRGRVTAYLDANNHTWQTSWTGNNDVAGQTTPSGHTTSFSYDTNNNLTTVTSPPVNGSSMTANCAYTNTTWIYQPSSCTDEQGHTTSYGYDSQGRLNSVTDASNHSSSAVYNSNGTLASTTDENGHTTSHTYVASGTRIGLPLQDTPPSPKGTTQYTFTSANLESTVTDGNGKTSTFSYDADGQETGVTWADGTSMGYSYDADGNVLAMTDSTGTTTYSYNNLDDLTSETLPTGQTISYTYDAVGNLHTKTDGGGTVTYGYAPNDQVTSVTDRVGGAYTLGYDQDGQQTNLHFPNGVTESMTYNSAGQLSTIGAVTSTQQTLTSYSYNYTNPTTNQPTSLLYSVTDVQGNTTSYGFDATDQLTSATKKSSGGSTLASYSYGYDPAGNLTSKVVGGITTNFIYNAANELTSAIGGLTRTYTYDGNGDRTSSSDGTSITVNTAGQLTSITYPGGGGGTVNYTYSGPGEEQRVGAGSNKYQYDGTGLNVQTDSTNNKTYFTMLPDGALLSETIPSGLANAGTYYYLSDGAGNVVAVVDSAGTVRNSYTYDPLGAFTVSGSQQVSNPFTFQGWMYESQTGYYYTGGNYYDPATGQSFGCTDKGRTDPGEDCGCPNDSCGEDENPACKGVCTTSSARPMAIMPIGFQTYSIGGGNEQEIDGAGGGGGDVPESWLDRLFGWGKAPRAPGGKPFYSRGGGGGGGVNLARFPAGETIGRLIDSGKIPIKGQAARFAPPKGGPSWDQVRQMTVGEFLQNYKESPRLYSGYYKILTQARFHR